MASAGTFHRRERAPLAAAVRVAALCALALPAVPAAEKQVSLTAVRHWSLGSVTRIALETSGEVSFRHDRLHNPERIYFDLTDTRSLLARRGAKVYAVGDRLVKQIRVAQTQRTVARVVIDLVRPVDFSTSQLSTPDRLVIEIREAAPAPPEEPGPVPVEVSQERPAAPAKADEKPPQETRTAEAVPPSPAPAAAGAKKTQTRKPDQTASRATAPAADAASPMAPAKKPEASSASAAPPPTPAPPPAVPAKNNSLAGRSLTRALGLKLGRIVLDPGHGGHDHGTTGPKGLTEKELALDIAKRLGALIEEEMGSEVIYTRTADTFVPLETRTQIANDAKADLFLSIHANSSRILSIAGVETFYLDFTTSKADLDVAARENASSDKKIFELEELVKKITLTEKVKESREFAARMQGALHSGLVRGNSRLRDRGVKKAPFIVLIGASMPSVLIEIGFLSNPREEALFSRPDYRQKVAEGLLKGLAQYASSLSHFQVARSKD